MDMDIIHDLSVVLDGMPYLLTPNRALNPSAPTSQEPGSILHPSLLNAISSVMIYIPICSSTVGLVGYHFDHMWYDPSISVAFNGEILSPTATKQQKEDKRKFIGLGVGLAVFVVLVIIVFIIIYLSSSTLRSKIRPFRARKYLQGVTTNAEEGMAHVVPESEPGVWTPGHSPRILDDRSH